MRNFYPNQTNLPSQLASVEKRGRIVKKQNSFFLRLICMLVILSLPLMAKAIGSGKYYSTVHAKVKGAGKVYVGTTSTKSPNYKSESDATQDHTYQNHTYHLYAQDGEDANGLVNAFTHWEDENEVFVTNTQNDYNLTVEGVYEAEKIYNFTAVFKPFIQVNTDALDFWQAPGYTHEKTFTVTTLKNMSGNTKVSISSSNNNVFKLSTTSFGPNDARNGKNVTVTFQPPSANLQNPVQEGNAYQDGEYKGTITIKYNNKTYHTISVTGKTYHFPVTVSDAKLSTLYYDKPLVIPYENDKLLNVEYVKNLNTSENTAEMRSVTQVKKADVSGKDHYIIPKEFGVIIETVQADTYRFPVYNNYNNEQLTIDGNNLQGLLENTATSVIQNKYGENAKILTLGKRAGSTDEYGFYKYTYDTMWAYKAYLVYELQSGASNDAIFFSIGGSGSEYTAIQNVENVKKQTEDGAWYTLQGVRLNDKPTQRGLYLHNGKKIMVK